MVYTVTRVETEHSTPNIYVQVFNTQEKAIEYIRREVNSEHFNEDDEDFQEYVNDMLSEMEEYGYGEASNEAAGITIQLDSTWVK